MEYICKRGSSGHCLKNLGDLTELLIWGENQQPTTKKQRKY